MKDQRVIGITLEELEARIESIVQRVVKTSFATSLAEKRGHSSVDWVSNSEALKLLRVSRPTLQRWRSSGKLPYSKIGSSIYYRRADLEALLEEHIR